MEVHLHDRRIAYLREIGFPFSSIGRCADVTGLAYTDIDFEQTVREAVARLVELGHTEIAFLNYAQEVFEAGYGPAVASSKPLLALHKKPAFPRSAASAILRRRLVTPPLKTF